MNFFFFQISGEIIDYKTVCFKPWNNNKKKTLGYWLKYFWLWQFCLIGLNTTYWTLLMDVLRVNVLGSFLGMENIYIWILFFFSHGEQDSFHFFVYFILQNSSINWNHDSFNLFCLFYFTEFYSPFDFYKSPEKNS